MAHLTIVERDTEAELQKQQQQASDEAFKIRLKAIRLAKKGKKRYEIADQLMVDPKSVTIWLQRYNEKGVAGLVSNKGGRPKGNPKWSDDIFTALCAEIDTGGYWSIPRMQKWISEQYKKDIPEQTVWYRIDQLNYSYKSARPHPVQGNKEKQVAFKKGVLPRSWSR